MTTLALVAVHAALLLALAATALVAGRLALRGVPAPVAMAFGLVLLGTAGCLLGLLGRLDATWLLGAVAAIHAAGLGVWRSLARRAREEWSRLRAAAPAETRATLLRGSLALAFAAPLLVLATYPPTAFDETLYHLPFARAFAATGGLPFLPDLRFPIFPQLAEVLGAELLLLAGDAAPHLVELLATLLTAALLIVWGRESGGADGRVGSIAAAAWIGNPLVVYLSGTGYVEPLLALSVTAGSWAVWSWRRGGGASRLALAGAFAGAAAATKYTGLYFVVALVVGASFSRRGGGAGGRIRSALLVAGAALLVMAPWYGRILAATGNPLFPYLSGLFGANAWTPDSFDRLELPPVRSSLEAVGRAAAQLATLPWDAVARRHLVGNVPPLSPAWLLALPAILAAAVADRRARLPFLLAVGFVAFFPALPADTRHLVAVLPLLSFALGWTMDAAARRWPDLGRREVTSGLVVLLALPGWLYAGYRLALQGPPPATAPAREAYLLRTVPLYPAVSRVNALLREGDTVYGLRAEQMRAHVRGRYLSDWYGHHRYDRVERHLGDPEALRRMLTVWGVDYLLVAEPYPALSPAVAEESGLELVFADRAARLYALRP